MTAVNAISRLNATINDHSAVSNLVALGVLTACTLISAAAITYNGSLASRSIETLVPITTVTQKPAATTPVRQTAAPVQTPTLTLGQAAPLSLQNQTAGATNLQPAQANADNTHASATSLQPGSNGLQLADANLQPATTNVR